MNKTIREKLEERERLIFSPFAMLSSETRGRLSPEEECPLRPAFQHDRDRIIHSKSFRRLKDKTQVFLIPTGDHYRTRLTHTLEVSQIARTISKALQLNEDLTEAISLGHDLGHTPFGHAGEDTLNELVQGGFSHADQSLRVVDLLERDGRGLNLTQEVRDGILKHSKGKGKILCEDETEMALTLEGRVVRIADIIAYVNHDIDDAVRAGMLGTSDLPQGPVETLGATSSARIARMVKDVVTETQNAGLTEIRMSQSVLDATLAMRSFLFEAVYENGVATSEFKKADGVLGGLWEKVRERPDEFLDPRIVGAEGVDAAARDFLAGMTDRFAVALYEQLFIPKPWIGPIASNRL
jgi:dGTPase